MKLQIVWDCDSSIDIYPLSKKSEQLIKEGDIDGFLDHLRPKFGNIDNHSIWAVVDEPEIRRQRIKV